MLFSPEPKTRREDLYDFNRELSALVTALRAERPPRLAVGSVRRLTKPHASSAGAIITPVPYGG